MKPKTVLILGAGASRPYGFPLGYELTLEIIQLLHDESAHAEMGFSTDAVNEFIRAFRLGQSNSIDQFLGRRPEYSSVGKAAIAYLLIRCEKESDVFNSTKDDHWYKYLLNQITTDDWESFDPSWLSIVSFNYDRSLRFYLQTALMHQYGKSPAEVAQKLSTMRFVNVYGSLGDSLAQLPYGGLSGIGGLNRSVEAAAKELIVIPEGRNDADSVTMARTLISEAQKIGILGFGFDQTNIRRIGAPRCFLDENRTNNVPKRTVATCFGLYESESNKAIAALFGAFDHYYLHQVKSSFYADNCINTLRQSLILD